FQLPQISDFYPLETGGRLCAPNAPTLLFLSGKACNGRGVSPARITHRARGRRQPPGRSEQELSGCWLPDQRSRQPAVGPRIAKKGARPVPGQDQRALPPTKAPWLKVGSKAKKLSSSAAVVPLKMRTWATIPGPGVVATWATPLLLWSVAATRM